MTKEEKDDIEITLMLVKPLLKRGIPVRMVASKIGIHADDMQSFLDGKASLTSLNRASVRKSVVELTRIHFGDCIP